MKITIKDFEIVGSATKFVKPSTMIVNGVEYLVWHTKTVDNGNGTLTIELEASEDWIAAGKKEEKAMLNFDKYREEIMSHPEGPLGGVMSVYFGDVRTAYAEDKNVIRWLLSEYEPPLLENGYGLKPGDWIMVREHEHDSWDKMRFACFVDGLFYVIDDALGSEVFKESGTNITGWEQARLPEEGE